MAIGTPTALGNSGATAAGSSIAFTSSAAVPSGAAVIVSVSWYGSAVTVTSITGGSLTWGAADKTQQGVADTNYKCALYLAQAPAGVASSTVFTANFSASAPNVMIGGFYCTGLATSSPVDATGGNNTTGASTAWSAGSISNTTPDALIVAACAIDALRTSSVTSPIFEVLDFQNTAAITTQTVVYQIVAAASSYTISGTLDASNSLERVAPVVAYKAAGAAAAAPVIAQTFNPIPFMGGH